MPPKRRRNDDEPGPSGRNGGGDDGGGGGAAVGGVQQVHRFAFVQHLIKHGYMTEAKAKEAFQRLTGLNSDDQYRRMVADQNREMAGLNLQIKTMKYPLDQERYVGFINTHVDAPSKFGTRYTPQEREFFRMVMEAIAEDDRAQDGVGAMSSTYLLNKEVRTHAQPTQKQEDGATQQQQQSQQQGPAVKMTKVAKEAALGKLVADGWLKHGSRSGEYALGVRTFLELGHQLLELPDLPEDTKAAWQDLM